jgi:hypothetical protein
MTESKLQGVSLNYKDRIQANTVVKDYNYNDIIELNINLILFD